MSKFKIANFTNDPALKHFNQGVPFHGDQYLIDYIGKYMEQSDVFVETGTNYGDSLYFIQENFPDKIGYSCEPDTDKIENLSKLFNLSNKTNMGKTCTVWHEQSVDFLNKIIHNNSEDYRKKSFKKTFWLDAHGSWFENGVEKFSWPLHEEVDLITKNFKNYAIFIDDFANPFNPEAKFDVYGDKLCAAQEVHDVLNGASLYHLTYNKVTSIPQPFIVGCGLITDMEPLPTDNDMKIIKNENPSVQYMLKKPETQDKSNLSNDVYNANKNNTNLNKDYEVILKQAKAMEEKLTEFKKVTKRKGK
jgi:hypothetical protein